MNTSNLMPIEIAPHGPMQGGFEKIRQTYYDRFQPADRVERDLVDTMARATSRIAFAKRVQTALIEANTSQDPATSRLLNRYRSQSARQYKMALSCLADVKNNLPLPARAASAKRCRKPA